MTTPFKRLLGLKESRQQYALKALQAKRGEVFCARQAYEQAQAAVHASAAGYARWVDVLYAPILGQITDLSGIEEIENRIAQLDVEHQALVETEHDALDWLEELEEVQTLLSSAYASATRACEKFRALHLIIEEQNRKTVERREEMQLEEGFVQHEESLI